jgi:hypothetical protein
LARKRFACALKNLPPSICPVVCEKRNNAARTSACAVSQMGRGCVPKTSRNRCASKRQAERYP